MPAPTLRDIARRAGVGLTAVSLALRGSPKISEATKARVRKVADSLGYRPDPLVAAYQARVRSLQPVHYQATLGWIDDYPEADRWPAQPEFLAAQKRAEELGYQLDIVRLDEIKRDNPADTAARFKKILRARGIHAAILPQLYRPHLIAEEWPEISVVLLGHELGLLQTTKVARRRDTAFHEVASDDAYNVTLAVRSLKKRGYTRVGMAVTRWHDRSTESLCTAGFLAQSIHLPAKNRIPPLILDRPESELSQVLFGRYVKTHKLDAVLVSNLESLAWCRALKLRVPRDIALAHVSLGPLDGAFSGIDPRLDLLAASAVDMVTSHLQRNERGEPPFRKRMLIPGVWRDAGTA
jgi:DNA-binding LacI/PurR family transcriptional regulator